MWRFKAVLCLSSSQRATPNNPEHMSNVDVMWICRAVTSQALNTPFALTSSIDGSCWGRLARILCLSECIGANVPLAASHTSSHLGSGWESLMVQEFSTLQSIA